MKKFKKITIALASMLLMFSMASAVTGTVAWFTAANTVKIDGMSIKAETEDGIVIADQAASYTDASWKNSAIAENTGAGLSFIPTSTANLTSWFHNNSDSANEHTAANPYITITGDLTDNLDTPDGYFVADNEGINDKKVYLINKFYIQSSGSALADQYLYVQNLNVTVTRDTTGNSGDHNLNKALRVGFICNGIVTIFAPIAGATASYNVFKAVDNNANTYDSVTAVPSTALSTKIVISGESNATKIAIPQYTAAGTNKIEVDVFAYFEGEDAACTSANAALGLDTLALKFEIGNTKDTTDLVFDY